MRVDLEKELGISKNNSQDALRKQLDQEKELDPASLVPVNLQTEDELIKALSKDEVPAQNPQFFLLLLPPSLMLYRSSAASLRHGFSVFLMK